VSQWYGYVGKIAFVDLSREKVDARELNPEDANAFIGGVGLAAKIIVEELEDPKIDPLNPENVLVFMTGPLTGTPVYGSGRYVVAAKSPLTGAWGEAHASGYWGVELKKAGFDGIVIKGRASDPVYLYVHDGEVEIRDASKLWGLDTFETDEDVRKELGDTEVKVATIGRAGERLARIACIVSDVQPPGPRVAGRAGLGAVMGSKNLKAVTVRGTGKVAVKDSQRVVSVLSRLLPLITSFPVTQILAAYGTAGEVEEFYEYGDMPAKNFTLGEFDYKSIRGQAFKERGLVIRSHGCWACPVKCWKVVKINGREMRAPEYETIAALGSLLMIYDPEYLVKANEICNRYGMDTISAGVTIAWAMEAYEKGLLTKEEIGGLELKWGDKETVLRLLKMMGEREGFGKILSEGVKRASAIVGKGSEELAMHVKGLEVPMHDPRAFKGMGLQYATSNRGACHLQGLTFRIEQGLRMLDLGIHERVDRFEHGGKGRIVATMQAWHEVVESLVLCKFIDIPPAHVAGLYTFVTGMRKTLPELLTAGRRIFTLKRLFNVACGIARKDDVLPKRFLKEPLKEGGAQGQVVELEPMLKEYYEYMKWDENGVPRKEALEELGLLDYAGKLGVSISS